MTDYIRSNQQEHWRFSRKELAYCRKRANLEARRTIIEYHKEQRRRSQNENEASSSVTVTPKPSDFAKFLKSCDGGSSRNSNPSLDIDEDLVNAVSDSDIDFLTVEDEEELLRFYVGKISTIIGPAAQISRLRRPEKVSATACALFRRFYLSNSVMIFDPKTIMVAAVFMGSKVEDATADVRYLEEATKLMQAPVTVEEILRAELHLVSGIHFELMCFHGYKPVLAFIEDLRTYLKSENGRNAVASSKIVTGGDLRPRYEGAKRIVDEICMSDIPLLFSTGQIGIAALIVANEEVEKKAQEEGNAEFPTIDLYGYLETRFSNSSHMHDKGMGPEVKAKIADVAIMIRELKSGNHGCGAHGVDMIALKGIHKRLKKCRIWGKSSKKSGKKKKKRKLEG